MSGYTSDPPLLKDGTDTLKKENGRIREVILMSHFLKCFWPLIGTKTSWQFNRHVISVWSWCGDMLAYRCMISHQLTWSEISFWSPVSLAIWLSIQYSLSLLSRLWSSPTTEGQIWLLSCWMLQFLHLHPKYWEPSVKELKSSFSPFFWSKGLKGQYNSLLWNLWLSEPTTILLFPTLLSTEHFKVFQLFFCFYTLQLDCFCSHLYSVLLFQKAAEKKVFTAGTRF